MGKVRVNVLKFSHRNVFAGGVDYDSGRHDILDQDLGEAKQVVNDCLLAFFKHAALRSQFCHGQKVGAAEYRLILIFFKCRVMYWLIQTSGARTNSITFSDAMVNGVRASQLLAPMVFE